jgi:hypothetical protein
VTTGPVISRFPSGISYEAVTARQLSVTHRPGGEPAVASRGKT